VVAARVLESWDATCDRIVKVMPRDYRKVLDEQRLAAAPAEGLGSPVAG
jgi:glutamate synthase domain-containing protein 3